MSTNSNYRWQPWPLFVIYNSNVAYVVGLVVIYQRGTRETTAPFFSDPAAV